MPSDTLYGLFAGYGMTQIQRMHQLKKRTSEKPFLLVFPEHFPLDEFVAVNKLDYEILDNIAKLWPGRNTLVLPKNSSIQYPYGDTIAIRKPLKTDNPFFYETLNGYNKPLIAPSLNISGDEPLTNLVDMQNVFANEVDAIFFDESFVPGNPSRIWDLTKKPCVRLR